MKLQKIIHIKLKLLLFLLFCFIHFKGISQEKLYLKGAKDYVLVKILSISEYKIRYKEWPATELMPYIDTYKNRIIKIVFVNGNTMRFHDDEWYCADVIYGENSFALKYDLLPMINGTYFFSAEWNKKQGFNLEIGAGYIDWKDPVVVDYKDLYEAKGFVLRAGLKVINAIDDHAFNGFYIKPELTYINHLNKDTVYIWTPTSSYNDYNETRYQGFGSFVNLGYQFSFKDVLLFDIYTGLGIAAKTGRNTQGKAHSNYIKPENTGNFGYRVFTEYNGARTFAMQAGFKIGFVLSKTNPKK